MSVRLLSGRLLPYAPGWDLRGVAFFLLVPLALAVMTATTTGYNRVLGYSGALLYVSLLSLIPWWIGEGATRIAWIVTRSYKPPLWLVCSLGVLLSCVFVGPYASFVSYLFKSYWSLGGEGAMIGSVANNPLLESLTQVVRAVVFWTAANYVFDRLLDYPRFRNEDASKNANPPNTSAFANMKDTRSGLLHRLNRIGALSDIIVVKAEEHYVRLYSEHDEELVAFSFGMAVKDLYGEDGFQVHRSHWVRRDAVLRVQDNGLRLTLEMKNGSVIPVSRPYHALIRQVL